MEEYETMADPTSSEQALAGSDFAGRPWRIFLGYTIWSLAGLLLLLPVLLLAAQDVGLGDLVSTDPAGATLLALQGITSAVAGLQAIRGWSRRPPSTRRDRWEAPSVGLLKDAWPVGALSLLPALAAVGLLLTDPGSDPRVAVTCTVTAVAGLLVRTPWWAAVIGAAVLIPAARVLGLPLSGLVPSAGLLVGFVFAMRSSLWLAGLVRELDRARATEAQFAVAEERLRFARDLHDVTGRDLSAIAVTAELTGQLIERQDARALGRSREVAQIARSCLAEVRALVRSYREADLATELQGTVSLLGSAGIATDVSGDPADVLPEHTETAAWVLREAGTNVLRHTEASRVRIELAPEHVVVENDGAHPTFDLHSEAPSRGSGLQGLAERIGAAGYLDASRTGNRFRLAAQLGSRGHDIPTSPAGETSDDD